VVHWLYFSVIRPSVTYASLVWWSGCQTASVTKKLSEVRNLACLGITGAVSTTPTHAIEALTCLPPLELVVQGEVRMAAHRLWSLGCWSYLHSNRVHSIILKLLQLSDPVFNMGLDAMRPTYNLEPKYRVTMLTKENWTRGSGAPPEVKGLVCYTDGPVSLGKLWEEGSAFPWVDIQQHSRPRYMLPLPVPMRFNLSVDRRNTVVYALIVKRH